MLFPFLNLDVLLLDHPVVSESPVFEIPCFQYNYEFDLVPGALDKLSYQVQMQIDLIANPKSTEFDYRVANYSRLSTYSFEYAGTEEITTNLGQRETLVFKRDKKNKDRKKNSKLF